MKIGLIIGIFDPPHNAHLSLAEEAKLRFNLDMVWFIPVEHPYLHENIRLISDFKHRIAMTTAAIEGVEWAHVFSYDECAATFLKNLDKENEYYLIMGADDLRNLEDWKNFRDILEAATIIAAHRNSEIDDHLFRIKIEWLEDNYGANILVLPFNDPLSGALVRDMARTGHSWRFFVPPATFRYIRDNSLYVRNR